MTAEFARAGNVVRNQIDGGYDFIIATHLAAEAAKVKAKQLRIRLSTKSDHKF